MGQYIHNSNELIYTNSSGGDIAAGEVVVFNSGGLCGVASSMIPNGAAGVVQLGGVWDLPTASSFSCTQGAAAYWDATNKQVISTVSTGTAPQIGVFAETLTASRGFVQVVLNIAAITKTAAAG